MSFSEWKYVSASSFCLKVTDGTHDSPKRKDSGKPLVTSKHIKGRDIDFDSAYHISEIDFDKINIRSKVDQWDVLISMIGEYCGYCYIERNEVINYAVKNVGIFKAGSKLKAEWIYYYLNSPQGKNILASLKSGTSQPYISLSALRTLQILIPSSEAEMENITSILSSLDDKIELNRQTNQTLEMMVQTIFKEMCLPKGDKLQDGWKREKLENNLKIVNGFAFKGTDFIEEGIPVIKIKNVKAGKVILNNLSYVSREIADKAQRFRIAKDDLLITMSGNRIDGTPETWVGKAGLFHMDGEYLLNQRVSKLVSNNENLFSKYYLCQLLSSEEFQYYFITNATSSGGQANISPELVKNIEISIPPPLVMESFNNIVKDIYNKIFLNEQENQTLSLIRDSLLLKLMKGEIEM